MRRATVSSACGRRAQSVPSLVTVALLLSTPVLPELSSAGSGAGAEVEQVRRVFDRYKAALMAGDGTTAAALVDQETLDYFARLRRLAISGGEEEIRSQSFIDRLLVVSIRHTVEPDEIEKLDLSALIELAVGEGWISAATVGQLEMGAVTIADGVATGEVLTTSSLQSPDAPTAVDGLAYRFVLQDEGWRFAFSSLVVGLNRVIAELTAQLGTDEDALIFMLVETFSGRKVLPEVWSQPDPPQ